MRISRTTNQISSIGAALPCRLRVIHGLDAGLEVSIPAVGVVVGAGEAADVKLADAAVSRRHCSIVPSQDGFDVTDLDSTNGTLLDGSRLKRATVRLGATLRVGDSLLQLMPGEDALSIAPSEKDRLCGMVGESLAMRTIYAILERASQSRAPILLLGESGTGKEVAARAIHDLSPRRSGAFVVFDCGASTETLIESDLFGHRKGAFTGAVADRPGAFEAAHQGTLFLDEIGDLPLALQPKLLRMLETGEVTALGSRASSRFDVRIVAATHKDLASDVARGTFRGDLYYRLAVVELVMPPLRQRAEDLEAIVRVFLEREGCDPAMALSGPNLDRLRSYHFPGNVRELRNVVTRAVALAPPGAAFGEMPILLGTRPPKEVAAAPVTRADRPFADARADLLAKFEREYLTDLLERARHNVSEAARISGVERKQLYRLIQRAGIPTRAKPED